jgi:hypothetical protein
MKTRQEVVAFIQRQLHAEEDTQLAVPDRKVANWISGTGDGKKDKWHYGKCELRQLLDFMYSELPAPDDELK